MFHLSVKCNIDNETSKGKDFGALSWKSYLHWNILSMKYVVLTKGAPESTKEHWSNPKALEPQSWDTVVYKSTTCLIHLFPEENKRYLIWPNVVWSWPLL